MKTRFIVANTEALGFKAKMLHLPRQSASQEGRRQRRPIETARAGTKSRVIY